MIFAIMRNGHEVLRGAMEDCQAALASEEIDLFKTRFADFVRWQGIHAAMEDGLEGHGKGMFAVLNEHWPGIADDLIKKHPEVDASEHLVEEAVKSGDIAAIKTAWEAFHKLNEEHLKTEEGIMMPKVMAMKEKGVPLKKVMQDELLSCAIGKKDMDFFVGFAMRMSEKYPGDMPRARVWAHALSAAATEAQWKEWHPIVKKNLSAELYAKIKDECDWADVAASA